ncbi:MAG: class I SAM-dependent methyltransferase [Candidatus Longimicrobiales bacterium M2_2A_002]
MTTAAPASTTLDALRDLFDGIEIRNFDVRLWDGTTWAPDGAADPAFTLVVERAGALRSLLHAGSEAALVEAYLVGDLSIEGDIYAVPPFGRALLRQRLGLGRRARIALRLLRLPKDDGDGALPGEEPGGLPAAKLHGELHSIERDRAAVTHHYDLSNAFYSLFLDPRMVYSCAVFRHPDEDLETAQLRKLDLICRKLRIREGDRLLDVGCGWGALIIHAAREYGALATGITLSQRQAELARSRIREAGLDGRCRVEVRDYRELQDEAFDRIASVGMFEHVGHERAAEYFATIHRLLRPGGSYLHHAITANPLGPPQPGPSLSDTFVFPDHELIPIGETLTYAEEEGFDIRDLEALREHYALTLRRWIAALERNRAAAVAEVGEPTWRAWHLMFAGSAIDFEANRQEISQVLMVKPRADGSAGIPLGREDWYDGAI